jgi:hypothetical protein
VELTEDTGSFTFFGPRNVELVLKVLDACEVPGFDTFWVFAAGLTNVAVDIEVVDTVGNATWTYSNPLGTAAFPPVQDTAAFDTCP